MDEDNRTVINRRIASGAFAAARVFLCVAVFTCAIVPLNMATCVAINGNSDKAADDGTWAMIPLLIATFWLMVSGGLYAVWAIYNPDKPEEADKNVHR